MTSEQRLAAFQQQFEIFNIPMLKQLEEEMNSRKFLYQRHEWGSPFIQAHSLKKLCKEKQLRAYLKGISKPDLCQHICCVHVSRLCKVCGALRISTYVLQRHALRDYLHWEEGYSRLVYNYQRLEYERKATELVVPTYTCPLCKEKYDSQLEVDECLKNHRIKRNFDLAKRLRESKHNSVAFKRLRYTIYRLYRQFDVSPNEIARALKMSNSQVQYLIGRVFAAQCLKSDSCVFKDYLKSIAKENESIECH